MSGFLGSLSEEQSAALAKLRGMVDDWKAELKRLDPENRVVVPLKWMPTAAEENGGKAAADAGGSSVDPNPTAQQLLEEITNGPFTVDDYGLLQLLRARKFDTEKAMELARKITGYRFDLQPAKISGAHIPNALPSKCWTWGGFTRAGNPILVIRARLWKPSAYESDIEYLRMIVYFAETAARSMGKGVERFTLLFDMKGFNSEMASPRALACLHHLVTLTQNMYPEHLASALLFNVPFVFRAVWAIVRPWIDPVTAAKVFFLGSDYQAELLEQIAPEMLCSEFGGQRKEPWPVGPLDITVAERVRLRLEVRACVGACVLPPLFPHFSFLISSSGRRANARGGRHRARPATGTRARAPRPLQGSRTAKDDGNCSRRKGGESARPPSSYLP